jgi:sulfur carrier protein ThiS
MRLHLGGHLDWYDPQKRAWLDLHLDAPLLLTDLLVQLGIPPGEVAIVAVDRCAVALEGTTVCDANRVDLYPPMGGGAIGGGAIGSGATLPPSRS